MISPNQQLKRQIISWSLSFIIALASFILAYPNVAYALTPANTNLTSASTESARELFRNAYEKRYTWDENFPGYSAEVSVKYGKGLYHGLIRVNPDLSVATKGINNDTVRELVENNLKMVVIHRRQVPFENIHGQNTFEIEGTDNTGSVKIREMEDGMDSHYKVREQKITQVNRVMGQVAVTVNTLGFLQPPEGYLAAHFQTTYRDAQTGEVLAEEDVSDLYDRIGNYFLLSRRKIRDLEPGKSKQQRQPDTSIIFNDFQPLLQG